MNYQTLSVDVDERNIAFVTLNVPEKRNALSAQMIAELTHIAQTFSRTQSVRVMVLSGNGRLFCAGGDLGWMKAQIDADRQTRLTEARKLAFMLRALNDMPIPLIGKIHGGAFGGAIGLACVCDVAIATHDTGFGFTETRLGLIPATISPYCIARMGEGKARRVFMSARIFQAYEAVTLNIIANSVPENELESAVEAEIMPYLKTKPHAVAESKKLARALGMKIDDRIIEYSITQLADIWESNEAKEGIADFFGTESKI